MDYLRSSSSWLALLGVIAVASGGCATVQPHEKELLADPAMVYGSGGAAARQEEHVLDNRTGSSSTSGSAGGCGCN